MIERPAWSTLRGASRRLLGAALVLAGVALVVVNAQTLRDFNAATARHGGQMIDLGHEAKPQAGQHGRMVRVVAVPTVVEAPHDPDFNLSANTPVLTRQVEMFQWREIRIGNSTHYEMDWVDHLVDAGTFDQPRGHANPAQLGLPGRRFDAGLVRMGGFRLSPPLQRALPGLETIAPDMAALPPNLAATFSRHGDYLQTSARADNPQLGDLRIRWEAIPLQMVTLVARLDGDQLLPAPDAADGQGYRLAVGDVDLLDMFPDLPNPPGAAMVKRGAGVLLAMLGALLLLMERRRALAVVTGASASLRWNDVWLAVGLGALVAGTAAATVWAGSDHGYMLYWIALALSGAGLAVWQWWRRD